MTLLDNILAEKLQVLEKKQQKRMTVSSMRHDSVYVTRAEKHLISFSCNDYLAMSSHPEVINAATKALHQYGVSSGASRMVTGDCPLYSELEKFLAEHHGMQAACVLGSGYLTNIGIIPALSGKNDLIITDKLAHASIMDGVKLSSATSLRFAHNNLAHLRMLLEANRSEYANCFIITETIFSMDGDVAPLAEIKKIAEEFNAWVISDDAHSIVPSKEKIDVKIGTLSKAAGSYGGYVCGSNILIDYIKNSARSLIFSTALPPATLAASIAALKIMKSEPERLHKPLKNAQIFTTNLGLPLASSAIVPLILGENEKALNASKKLAESGFLVTAIRPPTVPEHTARLRFTFSAAHTTQQIDSLCETIKKLAL